MSEAPSKKEHMFWAKIGRQNVAQHVPRSESPLQSNSRSPALNEKSKQKITDKESTTTTKCAHEGEV